jgi:P-type Cu2+ transporter
VFIGLLGYTVPDLVGADWISPVLGTLIFLYGGAPFLTGAWGELKTRRPGMMLLISMAITVALIASRATTLGISGLDLDFWWELAFLVTIMLLGHWLEMRPWEPRLERWRHSRRCYRTARTRSPIMGWSRSPLPNWPQTTLFSFAPGARVPADGVVVSGASAMDESMITGESRPLTGHEGDRVVAGTVATDNSIRVRVTAASEETALAGIQRLVGEAQRSHARAQALADRAAAFLSYFAAGTGLITFTAWTVLGNTGEADPGHLAHASA